MIAFIVIICTVGVALAVLAGAAWLAFDSDRRVRKFARSTELIPGQEGRAPAEWTTATSPEALLHRRIRYAIADVHHNPLVDGETELQRARGDLYEAVFELDDKLISATGLPEPEQQERLEELEGAVALLEELPTKLWNATVDRARVDIEATAGVLRNA